MFYASVDLQYFLNNTIFIYPNDLLRDRWTVVLLCFTCPAITVVTVILRALVRVRERALASLQHSALQHQCAAATTILGCGSTGAPDIGGNRRGQ